MFFSKCNLKFHCCNLCVEIDNNFYSNFQIPLLKCTQLQIRFGNFFIKYVANDCDVHFFRAVNLISLQTLDVLWHWTLALHYYIYYYYNCYQLYAGYLQLHTWNKSVTKAHKFEAVMYLQTVLNIMIISKWNVLYCYIPTFRNMCIAHYDSFVVAWYHTLLVRFSGIVSVIMIYLQLPLLFQESVLLAPFTCSKFLL